MFKEDTKRLSSSLVAVGVEIEIDRVEKEVSDRPPSPPLFYPPFWSQLKVCLFGVSTIWPQQFPGTFTLPATLCFHTNSQGDEQPSPHSVGTGMMQMCRKLSGWLRCSLSHCTGVSNSGSMPWITTW